MPDSSPSLPTPPTWAMQTKVLGVAHSPTEQRAQPAISWNAFPMNFWSPVFVIQEQLQTIGPEALTNGGGETSPATVNGREYNAGPE